MKRSMLMLCLLAMPLLAQETPKPEKPDVAALLEKIKSASPEEQQRLLEELKRLVKDRFETATRVESADLVFEVMGRGSQEKMKGSWTESGGISGEYVLTGLGNSRYRLEAVRTGPEGEATKIKDEGTLAELHKKYPFMRSFAFVTMVGPDSPVKSTRLEGALLTGPGAKGEFVLSPGADSVFGIRVRRPSEDLEYHLKLPTETTWIVESVAPGSRGAKLGLQRMDLVTEADGEDLADLKTLKEAKQSLTVVRRGKPVRISLAEEK